MDLYLNPYSIVGIASCCISCSGENIKYLLTKANNYIKRSGESEFPHVNLIVKINLLCNSKAYSIQIAPFSSNNEYALISGNDFSVFRVLENTGSIMRLMWNNEQFNIITEKSTNSFHFIINETNIVDIIIIGDFTAENSSSVIFPITLTTQSSEIYSILDQCLSELSNILHGYSLPEPFSTDHMCLVLEKMFTILRDPLLPSWQFQRYLDEVSALLPANLVSDLQQVIGQYTSNFSSLFSRFPSNKIKLLIENYVCRINNNCTKNDMSVLLRPTLELAEMYSSGSRGNAKDVIEKLLLDYLRVEVKFQDEETILNSNMICRDLTVEDVISHNNLANKNKLLLTLFEFLEKYIPGIILDLRCTIQKMLTNLTGTSYSAVISKLREVLVTGQMPSYEIRKNEMEAIFLNSIKGYSNGSQTGRIETLICSNSEVFDIISDFFYHKIVDIRRCAMEVYVRRAYMACDICSFEQSQLADGQMCVLFKFSLPIDNNNGANLPDHSLKRSNSYVTSMNNRTSLQRKYYPVYRKQASSGYIEKEDISDEELSNEEYFQLSLKRPKSRDYDTDSAISVWASSQSELSATISENIDSDGHLDLSKARQSPSVHSLDRLSIHSSNYSTFKDNNDMKRSDLSLEKSTSYHRTNRSMSMFCNNQSLLQVDDLSSQYDFGVMVAFDTIEEIERNLSAIRELLSVRNSAMDDMDYLKYDMSTLDRDCSPIFQVVLKFILRDEQITNKCDEDVAGVFNDFCNKHFSFFDEICVIRITFLLQALDKTIRYFTFWKKGNFKEDVKLRNIDPMLSFQLEITRLRNYYLERISVPNRRLYLYMGTYKEQVAEYRMFTRCIIYHKDFHLPTSNIDFVAKEAERNLLEAMDAFDMAWIDERANFTKSNHIFFYFHSILSVTKIEELENVVRTIIFKHGRRLWSLRITQAELKMSVKVNGGSPMPIRLWVHNEGGKSLEVSIYREQLQCKTDHKILVSLSPNKDGRYHGIPVDCFYSI